MPASIIGCREADLPFAPLEPLGLLLAAFERFPTVLELALAGAMKVLNRPGVGAVVHCHLPPE